MHTLALAPPSSLSHLFGFNLFIVPQKVRPSGVSWMNDEAQACEGDENELALEITTAGVVVNRVLLNLPILARFSQ